MKKEIAKNDEKNKNKNKKKIKEKVTSSTKQSTNSKRAYHNIWCECSGFVETTNINLYEIHFIITAKSQLMMV